MPSSHSRAKKGKARQDKFYHLAKEIGYRSRAAFKLIQLNKKFGFLDNSRVCVDLCAAPGGWMEVAHKTMLPSNIVIGIDQDPIKTMSQCITIQGDINSAESFKKIEKSLKNWKVDVVLCDGAPHYGADFQNEQLIQNKLVLRSLQISTCFLRKNGWFVTKVARTRFFDSLVNACSQFFDRVSVTKPEASKAESTEAYIVCKGYNGETGKKNKADHNNVFDAEKFFSIEKQQAVITSLHNILKKNSDKKLGTMLSHIPNKVSVSDFINSDNYLDILAGTYEIYFEDDKYKTDSLTTEKIKNYCQDLKLVNKSAFKELIKWRKGLIDKYIVTKIEDLGVDENIEITEKSTGVKNNSGFDLKAELKREKKKVKKLENSIMKKQEQIAVENSQRLQMDEDNDLFNTELVENLRESKFNVDDECVVEDEEEVIQNIPKLASDLIDADKLKQSQTLAARTWLNELLKEKEIDYTNPKTDSEDWNAEQFENKQLQKSKKSKISKQVTAKKEKVIELEKIEMNAQELALATKMALSKKSKRDLMEDSINRYINNDDEKDLPHWFVEDEKKNYGRCHIEGIDDSDLEASERKLNQSNRNLIGSKNLSKLAEVKARKRQKIMKKLQSINKSAQSVIEDDFMPTNVKVKKMRDMYRGILKQKDRKYIVTKKKHGGRLPNKASGPYKLVDRKMKKDNRVRKSKK